MKLRTRSLVVAFALGALFAGSFGVADAACVGLGSAAGACRPDGGGANREEFGSGQGAQQTPPRISVRNDSVTEGTSEEGTSKLRFRVVLDHASSEVVRAKFATSPGSATPGLDYTERNGTVTFQPGDTSKTIGVNVVSDFEPEGDEQLFLDLTKPRNGKIADGHATGTIVDDEVFNP